MANASNRRTAVPGWVKGGIVGLLVLIGAGIAMIALGHNPLQHMAGHAGMNG